MKRSIKRILTVSGILSVSALACLVATSFSPVLHDVNAELSHGSHRDPGTIGMVTVSARKGYEALSVSDEALSLSDPKSESKMESAKELLNVKLTETIESPVYIDYASGSEGPEAAAVAGDTIFVLDRLQDRIIRYENGSYRSEIQLDSGFSADRIVYADGLLYVLERSNIGIIDVNDNTYKQIPLPCIGDEPGSELSLCVYDMRLFDSQLVLITEAYGNFVFNPETEAVEPTKLGYTVGRYGDYVRIAMDGRQWNIYAPQVAIDVAGFGKDGSIFVYAVDLNDGLDLCGIYTIRKYEADGKLSASCCLDCAEWKYLPHVAVQTDENGISYVFEPRVDGLRVMQLDITAERSNPKSLGME